MKQNIFRIALAALALASSATAQAQDKIRVLIVDGHVGGRDSNEMPAINCQQ